MSSSIDWEKTFPSLRESLKSHSSPPPQMGRLLGEIHYWRKPDDPNSGLTPALVVIPPPPVFDDGSSNYINNNNNDPVVSYAQNDLQQQQQQQYSYPIPNNNNNNQRNYASPLQQQQQQNPVSSLLPPAASGGVGVGRIVKQQNPTTAAEENNNNNNVFNLLSQQQEQHSQEIARLEQKMVEERAKFERELLSLKSETECGVGVFLDDDGITVNYVDRFGPAGIAEIQVGDRILRVDGKVCGSGPLYPNQSRLSSPPRSNSPRSRSPPSAMQQVQQNQQLLSLSPQFLHHGDTPPPPPPPPGSSIQSHPLGFHSTTASTTTSSPSSHNNSPRTTGGVVAVSNSEARKHTDSLLRGRRGSQVILDVIPKNIVASVSNGGQLVVEAIRRVVLIRERRSPCLLREIQFLKGRIATLEDDKDLVTESERRETVREREEKEFLIAEREREREQFRFKAEEIERLKGEVERLVLLNRGLTKRIEDMQGERDQLTRHMERTKLNVEDAQRVAAEEEQKILSNLDSLRAQLQQSQVREQHLEEENASLKQSNDSLSNRCTALSQALQQSDERNLAKVRELEDEANRLRAGFENMKVRPIEDEPRVQQLEKEKSTIYESFKRASSIADTFHAEKERALIEIQELQRENSELLALLNAAVANNSNNNNNSN